jgi:hypothetical protein
MRAVAGPLAGALISSTLRGCVELTQVQHRTAEGALNC